jgi:hypothetical protein
MSIESRPHKKRLLPVGSLVPDTFGYALLSLVVVIAALGFWSTRKGGDRRFGLGAVFLGGALFAACILTRGVMCGSIGGGHTPKISRANNPYQFWAVIAYGYICVAGIVTLFAFKVLRWF